MTDPANFGYLMVHFVEDPANHAEKIYFSLSRGEDGPAGTGSTTDHRSSSPGSARPEYVTRTW